MSSDFSMESQAAGDSESSIGSQAVDSCLGSCMAGGIGEGHDSGLVSWIGEDIWNG